MEKELRGESAAVESLAAFLKADPNVVFAALFGSGAKDRLRKKSDLDVGIFFKNPPEGLDLLDLINALSGAAGRDVDVVVLNGASAFLRHQVMKHRVLLTVKDETAYRRFREKTMTDYEEYKYISGMNAYDR